ncbi:MAG: phosphate ABC transporter permease family protein, partial [Pseudomonadota bacterium]
MDLTTLTLVLFAVAFAGFQFGRARSLQTVRGAAGALKLESLPQYHGYYVALVCLAPALLVVLAWLVVEPSVLTARTIDSVAPEWRSLPPGELDLIVSMMRNLAAGNAIVPGSNPLLQDAAARFAELARQSRDVLSGTAIAIAALAGFVALRQIHPSLRARGRVETFVTGLLVGASGIALLTTLGIVLSVVFEAMLFFREVTIAEFLFGLEWSPQTAIRDDQVASTGRFGAVPLFAGTLLITLIAMLVAVPVGLMTAVYLGEYASRRIRDTAKPLLEVLAGIPTVV